MKEIVRSTVATRARIVKFKQLVHGLRAAGTMRLCEVADLLCFSESGARKYITELVADEIVLVAGFDPAPPKTRIGKTIYKLSDSVSIVDAFLERLDIAPQNLTQRRALADHSAEPRMQKVLSEDGRHIHMLRDDVKHNPRTSPFKIPAPDPLLAQFFGLGQAVA
jgi:hypothetical protein